jgi:hypothetical protein
LIYIAAFIIIAFMLERLSQNVEGKFWKGPDIVTASDVTIYRHTNIPIVITPNSLPPLHGLPPEALNGVVRASVRSRYAQLGIDLHDDIGGQIAQWIVENGYQTMSGCIEQEFEARAFAFNRCARPIFIPKGSHLFRFFYEFARPAVRGKDLISLIKSEEIKIDGKQDYDWMWSYNRIGSGEENIIGINIRIKSEGRKWISPHPTNEPIIIKEQEGDYREEIDELLVPIPQDKNEKLWIGETTPVSLGQSIEAILGRVVVRDSAIFEIETLGLQTSSRLIDGGKTNWPIRVEVLSATTPEVIPNYVHLHFVKNGH